MAKKDTSEIFRVALMGNPNVGKSTLFNSLTKMRQHTGNWAGKTVGTAEGTYKQNGEEITIIDLPGTYSLNPRSDEEKVARDYIVFNDPDSTVAVCDAGCLERNLILVLQLLEINPKVALCVNLIDEAASRGIRIDAHRLSNKLGVPVLLTSALKKDDVKKLPTAAKEASQNSSPYTVTYPEIIEDAIERLSPFAPKNTNVSSRWLCLRALEYDEELIEKLTVANKVDPQFLERAKEEKRRLYDAGVDDEELERMITGALVRAAEITANSVTVIKKDAVRDKRDRKIDRLLTGRFTGVLIMTALLVAVFWITVVGANYISDLLLSGAEILGAYIKNGLLFINAPNWLTGLVCDGIYRILSWVTCVMLPPMAIFFPLFTLLEDIGYLPRVAFNTDGVFRRCGACGKQALTTCMGFGCNAVGVTGCRIIDSPRERMIAILTNSFIPCNGKYAALTALLCLFVTSNGSGFFTALALTATVLLGVFMSLIASKLLSVTLLRGKPSAFTIELPPFRKPRVCRTLISSVFDRTLAVLGRAVTVAAPAGALIWLLCNIPVGDASLYVVITEILDPAAALLGLDGVILLAFIVGIPANEMILPLIVTGYTAAGSVTSYASLSELHGILIANGWTPVTAVCTVIFMLMHSPCTTTLLTVKKETGSIKTTFLAFILPVAFGCVFCALINLLFGNL